MSQAWAAIDPGDGTRPPHLAVGCSKNENHLCEQIPGMNYAKADGIWRAPLSWPAWVAFLTVWGQQPCDVHPALRAWADAKWNEVQAAYRLRGALDAGSLLPGSGPGEPELFPPQKAGAQWLMVMERGILGDPQGNGKTVQAVRAIRALRAQRVRGDVDGPWLVIAPTAALYNWQREVNAWAPELTVRMVDGTALKRRKAIMDEGEADVYVTGWSTLRFHTRLRAYPGQALVRCDEHGGSSGKTPAQCEVHEKELNAIRWAGIIPDEAHRMQDAKSKQTRAVWYLAGQARFFWPMTGTMIGDSVADLWPVLHGIDPLAFPSKSRYLDLYAVKNHSWHGGTDILGIKPETAGAFHATVQPLIRRIPKEVMRPFMPPRLPVTFRNPEMAPSQARAYAQMKKQALAELEHSTVPTQNDLGRFVRLCQLASASIETYDAEDQDGFYRQGVKMTAPSSKADDLIDFLADNPGPLVACMNSPQLLELCEQKLAQAKITNCAVKGGQSAAERDTSVQFFQNGDCRVILLTARAGGEAITLTASSTVLFLQPDPSYRATEQVIGRVDRIGQAEPVRVVYSVSRGTVDERLYQLSQDKSERANEVFQDAALLRWLLTGDEPVRHAPAPADEPSRGQAEPADEPVQASPPLTDGPVTDRTSTEPGPG